MYYEVDLHGSMLGVTVFIVHNSKRVLNPNLIDLDPLYPFRSKGARSCNRKSDSLYCFLLPTLNQS